jgi:hypothetical protein
MFDTIYVHAGLPKTGSTFIQNGLQTLSRAGRLGQVAYPAANPELGSGNGTALSQAIIFTNPAETTREQLQQYVDDILAANHGAAPNLLISSEDLCYADVEKFARLKEVLLTHAKTVRLIVSARPLKAWTYSVYLQLVKAHGLAAEYDAGWLEAHSPDFLYYFRNLDRFGVDTITFRYQGRGLLRLFLRLIGENEGLASEIPDAVANRSLSLEELEVMRAINRVFQDDAISRVVSRNLVKAEPDRAGARFPAHSEDQFQAFASGFARKLDQFPGPVMSAIREILFEDETPPPPENVRDVDDRRGLPAVEAEVALRALRELLDAQGSRVAAHDRLLAYAATLPRTDAFFDPIHYLLMHPDVLSAGIDPWLHYQEHGREEGRMTALKPRGRA